MSRLERIRSMLQEEPDDLFLNFGLAMELVRAGRVPEALEAFDRVISLDADHVPGYSEKAKTLLQMGRKDEARACLRHGIDAATRSGDTHAADEMNRMLTAMG